MPRQHQTLLVPGNDVTAAETLLLAGTAPSPGVLAGPFRCDFNSGHAIAVMVVFGQMPTLTIPLGDGPHLVAVLYSPNGSHVDEREFFHKIDQDYSLEDGNNVFELSILRAANTALTPEIIKAYDDAHGGKCPACGSTDIHGSRPEIDGPNCRCRIECCSCNAHWVDTYKFSGISTDPEDWDVPSVNVRRQG